MKNKQTILKTVLLSAFTILLFSCNKDVVEPTPPTLNYSTFTDSRDGKIYKSIKIGNQEWMAENLAFKTESGSWDIFDDESYRAKYGCLYSWTAAKQAVPAGWHLPTDAEWKQLEMSLGMSQAEADGLNSRGTDEGGKLKATSGWADSDQNGTNDVGFSAISAGLYLTNSHIFMASDWFGYWWTATESDSSNGWFRLIVYGNSKITRNTNPKYDGFSVRCVKN